MSRDSRSATSTSTMFVDAGRRQLGSVRAHPIVAGAILVLAIAVVWLRAHQGNLVLGLGYVAAMWLAAYAVDCVTISRTPRPLPVRRPALETTIVAVCIGLGGLWLWLRFVHPPAWDRAAFLLDPPWPLVGIALVFPIVLAAIFLALRYRPIELGVRPTGLVAAALVISIVATMTLAVAPEHQHWRAALDEMGCLGLIFTGFVTAALSEELTRMLLQTRIGATAHNAAFGWLVAVVPWALLHVPKMYGESGDLADAVKSAVGMMPIGLLWGYLTYRTGSLLPAVLVHGSNLWGLQNS